MCLDSAERITGDFKNMYLLLLFKDKFHNGYVQKIKVKEKCLLYKKGGIKYQEKGSTPLFHTTYKHLKHKTIYLTKINCYAMVLGEFCKKLLSCTFVLP